MAVTPALALDPGVDPQAVTGALQPGGTMDVAKTVHTPEIAPKPDIYFLADTTGSMGTVLTQVKLNAANIVAQVDSQTTDARYGAGDYKDFPPTASPPSPYAFLNTAPIPPVDDGGASALAAIATWTAAGGGDGPEGQFYALHRLAGHAEANFRPDSTRIIVWFGDAPGHDPICTAISGDAHAITEASVTADLVGANIRVIAISTTTGFANGLDDDPSDTPNNYTPFCTVDGSSGQASRIAAATGGVHLQDVAAADISAAILAGLRNLPVEVTPSVGVCDPRLSLSFDPTTQTVTSGDDASFTETIDVSPTALAGVATCQVDWLLNGQPAGPAFTQTIVITIIPGPPATLVLTPPTATNTVGAQHCVTAVVRDSAGNPVPGVVVQFTVTGANTTSGNVATGPDGMATFCYNGTDVGADVITARVTGIATPATAAKLWVPPAVDHYKCYQADQKEPRHKDKTVKLKDQFGEARMKLGEAEGLCNPVSKNGEPVLQPEAHFKVYEVKKVTKHHAHEDSHRVTTSTSGGEHGDAHGLRVEVTNQFGTQILKVKNATLLLVPASKSEIPPAHRGDDPGAPPRFVDHYLCYEVDGPRMDKTVTLEDQFGREQVKVRDAELLCNPVSKNGGRVLQPDRHLVCYTLKSTRGTKRLVNMHDQFGLSVLRTEEAETLCVPSTKRILPPTPGGSH